jgi:hypothetical protein
MVVPKELERLELYAADEKFCSQWPDLLDHWRETYPQLDILAEVKRAHEWEWIRPKYLRKKNRKSFLGKWLARAFYRLPPAERCRTPTDGERHAMIEKVKCRDFVTLHGAVWEVRTHGLQLISGHAESPTRPWNSLACWELKEVGNADDYGEGIQAVKEAKAKILPQPKVGEDGGRDYF